MPIRWDSLLVHHLAQELDDRLRGARLRALRLDGGQGDLVLLFRSETLVWRLHPTRGHLRFYPAQEPGAGDLPLSMRVRGVEAPPDERLLRMVLLPVRGRRQSMDVLVELLGNQWNAVVTEGPEHRIRHILNRKKGARELTVGAVWSPPPPSPRLGIESPPEDGVWAGLAETEPGEARRRLVASVAWTSPVNAGYILGEGDARAGPALKARWESLAPPQEPRPVLLELPKGLQPYPTPLPGTLCENQGSLLEALEKCAVEDDGDATGPALLPSDLFLTLDRAVEQAERRVTSLEAELADLDDEESARGVGDLLLARFHLVRPGASEVVLDGFDGTPVRVTLDPALTVQQNAAARYDEAARIGRARERLPGLIAEAQSKAEGLRSLLARARDGEATAEEVRAALPRGGTPRAGRTSPAVASRPYHVFRSSGGLEIRVGRGAKHNDDLTFRHSAPNDIWLHARHAQGAHVILRWTDPGTPPAKDLEEAAVLAALNSKARTSGTVPVDWTLRKYVRKPRGAPPGTVVPQRVKTVFVEPDPGLPDRLSGEDG